MHFVRKPENGQKKKKSSTPWAGKGASYNGATTHLFEVNHKYKFITHLSFKSTSILLTFLLPGGVRMGLGESERLTSA
jgi:hypothetical protein